MKFDVAVVVYLSVQFANTADVVTKLVILLSHPGVANKHDVILTPGHVGRFQHALMDVSVQTTIVGLHPNNCSPTRMVQLPATAAI